MPGKLSDITLTEKVAKITLKLVSNEGGVIADTRWSILTQAGDLVTSGVGAFPSFVLAEGDYTVIANHEDGQFRGSSVSFPVRTPMSKSWRRRNTRSTTRTCGPDRVHSGSG